MLEIATETRILRASKLPELLECPASVILQALGDPDTSGPEAATGSLVHSGVAEFHRSGENKEAGLAALYAAREKFPLGDPTAAEKHYVAYCNDPANRGVEIVKNEEPLVCRIKAPDWDTTGQGDIVIRGTLDQIRRYPGKQDAVCDIKTGKTFYGEFAIRHYAPQQAAYTVGAWQTWGLDVRPGPLICTDGYFRRNGQVHWWQPWDRSHCEVILEYVAVVIAAARMGFVGVSPGTRCGLCKFKGPENCLPKLRSIRDGN